MLSFALANISCINIFASKNSNRLTFKSSCANLLHCVKAEYFCCAALGALIIKQGQNTIRQFTQTKM